MIFRFRVLYVLIFAHLAKCELNLKIDFNERTDNVTTVNYLNITFVNTTDSEHMVQDDNITLNINEETNENFNEIHQVVKRNPKYDPMYISYDIPPIITTTALDISPTQIPIIQWKGDNSVIKKFLDDFKMNKRRTYVSTPNFNFPFKRMNSIETGFEKQDFRRKYIQNPKSQKGRENDIFDLISKQNKLIERIADKVSDTEKRKKKIARTIFDDILESVEERYKKTKTQENVTTTAPNKLSTVLTLIDETEIRNALKKDPFINRILRMAAKKKQEYEEKRQSEKDYLS